MHRLCPLCGADNHAGAVLHRQEGREIKRCTCGMVYLENPEPEADRLPRESDNSGSERMLRLIRRHFRPGNVLELGCGSGTFLQRLDSSYIPFGIETSRVLAPIADSVARGRGGWVVHATADDGFSMFSEEHFSGVVMDSFLEREMHPVEVLQQCARHLERDGKVIIRVPNYDCLGRRLNGGSWRGFHDPDAINYFTPPTLVRMCREAGLSVHRFRWSDHQPLAGEMWLVAARHS